MGRDDGVFVHPHALCESGEVGPRTRIWAFAHVLAGARIGSDCNLCDHVFVEGAVCIGDRVTVKNGVLLFDGVVIEDDVFVGPNAVFTNDRAPRGASINPRDAFVPVKTKVRSGATIGANATIVCGVTVGSRSLVGAGAVVTRDVPCGALVVGNPARRIGWVCACGERLASDLRCQCGRHYELVDDRRGIEAVG
jgi:UDP-2-acetamido-3-amino-2,3-dideoxy-glucuronate N-acetyltransferase